MRSILSSPPTVWISSAAPAVRLRAIANPVFVAFLAVATFPPLIPRPRVEGFDESWQMALHESVARGFVYGREFAFTYGPLGFLAYPFDIGGLSESTAVWRLLIHLAFCVAVGLNIWSCPSMGLAGLLAVTIAFSQVRVELTPRLLLAEVAFLTFAYVRGVFWPALPAAALAAVGLLVKVNTGAAGAISLAFWLAVMVSIRRGRAVGAWLVPIVAVFLATVLTYFRYYGGPLDAMSDYLAASLRIAGGYSAQLSIVEKGAYAWQILTPLAAVAAAVIAGAFLDRRYALTGVILSGVFFNLLKSAGVRSDPTHFFTFFEALPGFVALFLVLPTTTKQEYAAATLCVAVLAYSVYFRGAQYLPPKEFPAAAYLPDGPRNLLDALHWEQSRRAVGQLSDLTIARQRLPAAWLDQIGTEPVDAYPSELSVVFANGLNWCPRPMPQSMTAYTPELDGASASFYRAPAGPRWILFEQTALDRQHPWFIDPLTLRELYNRYELAAKGPRYLLLKRRSEPRGFEWEPIGSARMRLGDRIPVPRDESFLVAAAMRFRLTGRGRWADWLWKVYPPSVRLEFACGDETRSQLTWRNAINGFLVSELPTTLGDADALWNPARRSAVTAMTLLGDSANFEEDVEVTWLRTCIPARPGGQ
jgi:hypothetical protein